MTRRSFRNFALLVLGILVLASWFVLQQAQSYQNQIVRADARKERLTLDLLAGNRRAAALATLDKLTIDEANATRLDILRHLNLERTELQFQLNSKAIRKVGPTDLYIRSFTLGGSDLTYSRSMELLDWLNSSNKVALNNVYLAPGTGFGDSISFRATGVLYGLMKSPEGR